MHAVDRRITELSAEWMSLIAGDHHKDRDCHFSIEKRWSYGNPPVYTAYHEGYVAEAFDQEFDSYAEAATWLIQTLEEMIREERKYAEKGA